MRYDTHELKADLQDMIRDFVVENGVRDSTITDVLGTLEAAKSDFIRRVVDPYEENKFIQNGTVYAALFLPERPEQLDEDWAFPEDDLTFRPL